MYEGRFSAWRRWPERNDHAGIARPGVYVIAVAPTALGGRPFSWRREIVYVGMTNAVAGLRGRLDQFDRTMVGTRVTHGGADRVRFKCRNYMAFTRRAWVAVAPFPCDPASLQPRDLRAMGDVAKFEYECLAQYVERFDTLPKFNDKARAPKFSLVVGRSSHAGRH